MYFITWNNHKFSEAKIIFPDLEQIIVDLLEIQSLDPYAIIWHKLQAAQKLFPGKEMIVEDTSLVFDAWNGLPGPFIKRYLDSVKDSGIREMIRWFDNKKAQSFCTIGYSDGKDILFFQWTIQWTVVEPVVSTWFGRDALFQPDWYDKTFAHMTQEEKNAISHRGKALRLLQDFLSI